ncbi:MAG: Xaa-Pro peptidase family protein [Woeseia sp.]
MSKPMTHKQRTLQFGVPDSEVPFPREEYERRLGNVRSRMADAGIDLLYVTNPDHICYLSGYQAEWFQAGGPKAWPAVSGIAVHVDHDHYLHFESEDEKLNAQYTTWPDHLRIMPEHDISAGFADWIVSDLDVLGWIGRTVGLEFYSYRPNPADSRQLSALFQAKGATVVDGSDAVAGARLLKSAAELEVIREAARIGDIGLRAGIENIEAGMTELDVYAEIVYAMAKAGGENPAITLPVVSGKKSACFHALASRKKIEHGDIVNIDVCGVYRRYHSGVCRTVSIGEPDAEVADYMGFVTGALSIASGLLRPGLRIADFLDEMKRYYADCGLLENEWWIGGYELGIAFPPDWVGSYYFDIWKEVGNYAFEPGFVSNYEGNFYLPKDTGLSCMIDTMIVEEDAVAFIHDVPCRLFVAD